MDHETHLDHTKTPFWTTESSSDNQTHPPQRLPLGGLGGWGAGGGAGGVLGVVCGGGVLPWRKCITAGQGTLLPNVPNPPNLWVWGSHAPDTEDDMRHFPSTVLPAVEADDESCIHPGVFASPLATGDDKQWCPTCQTFVPYRDL